MKTQALLADQEIIVGHAILDPGERRAPEVHSDMSETILVLRGRLINETALETLVQVPGAATIRTLASEPTHQNAPVIQAGVQHAVSNASDTEPAEFLAIMRKVSA